MDHFKPTAKTQVRRLPKRGAYDRKTVESILDEGMVAHVGFVENGQPFVIPMIYGRSAGRLYLHGSAGGRALRALKSGTPLCVTVTIVDGLVMARSAFHHSMNYRSVVLLGAASAVEEEQEKIKALKIISDHLFLGRWADARKPNRSELKQTTVVSLPLSECSAKIRTGPPLDEEEDYSLSVWAGVLPSRLIFDPPVADPRLPKDVKFPAYLQKKFSAGV